MVPGFRLLSQQGDAEGGCRSREGPGGGSGLERREDGAPALGWDERLCRQRLGLPIPGHEATLQLKRPRPKVTLLGGDSVT